PYVEPGHPSMLLLSYRPLAKSSDAVSGVVLEMHNDDAAPTDAVELRVDDLNQVARMRGSTVYVPSLKKGATFRVHVPLRPAINTISGVPITESEPKWKQRYPNGVKLLAGTAKIGSAYTQYRQPPIVVGAADYCTGLGCSAGSVPYTAHIDASGTIGGNDLN